jgi:hypothetical protein
MSYTIDWRRLRDAGWWHWVLTLPLLAAHVALGPERSRPAFEAAAALCAAMAALAYWRTGDAAATAVQVRMGYLALLVLGLAPAAQWFHWVQLAGTSAMVAIGYCPLARMLSLAPWNRDEPLTAGLVRRTFMSRAAAGGILRPVVAPGAGAAGAGLSCADACPCGIPV